jgi:hypothetical protein
MIELLKPYLTIDDEDKKVWVGVLGVGLLLVVLLSIFTTTSFFYYLERYLITLVMAFLPGYAVMKIYFDKLVLSDNRIADKVIVAFGLSIVTMDIPYYLSMYLRPASFNTDEDASQAMSDTFISILLLLMVLGVAFGYKYFLNRKSTSNSNTSES